MKNRALFIYLSFIFCSFSSCDQGNTMETDVSENQLAYFQLDYINYAWGKQHSGWFIDAAGKVHSYHLPETWNSVDSIEMISSDKLTANILLADSITYTIELDILNEKIQLISKAAAGEISDPVNEMMDAGSTTYSAFIYQPTTDKYQKVLLKQTGDFLIRNNASEANSLFEWMQAINEQLHLK